MTLKSSLLTLCFLAIATLPAQPQANDYALYFKAGTVVPEANTEAFLSSYSSANETLFEGQFFKIIQFYEVPSGELKNTLKEAGVTLLTYLPKNSYFAAFRPDFNAGGLKDAGIRSIEFIDVSYKISLDLYEGNYPDHAILANGSINLVISYYPNLDPGQVAGALQAKGLPVIQREDFGHYINTVVPQDQIREIAALPFIVFMEPVYPEPEPENSTGRTLHRSNAIATDYGAGRHFDGTGVIVELQDDGIIGPHIDYQGRILAQFLGNNSGNHGDHCAGIIMGAGNVDPLGRGNAYGADLYVYGASPNYPGFTNIPVDYGTLGVRITSTSYSNGCNAGYTTLAQTMDQQVRTYPSLMHVFSAGNEGTSNCGYGAGPGWGNVTGGHKIGKNVIAVANLSYTDDLAGSSSRGPAHDGRIKPDLAAKGSSVYSTIDPNTYALKSGTSMACPGTAGTLAQLYQAYKENNSGKDPMGGLMKGILLNTAEDLGNPGPDFKFGWGRINALRAVKVIEEARYDSGTLSQGGTVTHLIDVPANLAQLRVMIYWTDYEASVNTNWALVNNLNMTLTDPGSATWLPWKLNHYPHPDSLNLFAFRGIDDRNNMEQVTLDDPDAGTYTVQVQGMTVPQGPQTYYIIYEFITKDVTLTYPVGGESMVPGETETIRWDASDDIDPYLIEASMDNGLTWESIGNNVSGANRHFNWVVPPAATGEALVRITQGSHVSQSETPFSILGLPCNLQVDWACTDVAHLSWSPVMGASSYEILQLGAKYMDSVGETSVNSYIIEGLNPTGSSWFSVRALGPDGATGRRAVAFELLPGAFDCYPTDAMMVSIPTANWGVYQAGQMDLSAVKVSVEIKNYGTEAIVNPAFKYQLDNGTAIAGNHPGTIDPDSTILFVFPEPIDLSAVGTYNLKAWIDYTPDQNPENDTLVIPFEVIDGSSISLGFEQNFDAWARCVSAPACELVICDLEEGWINLENGVYDMHDWRPYSGPTPTGSTGPTYDHTTGTVDGMYLYLEPSNFCLDQVALMNIPCVDLSSGSAPVLKLWYNAWGGDIGQFHVDLFDGSAILYDIVPPILGNQGEEWKELEIDLTPWIGEVVALQFRGVTSCGQQGDFAIDDFSIADYTAIDPGQEGFTSRFRVYPNPASGGVTLSLSGAGEPAYTLKVLDLFGRIVMTKQLKSSNENLHEQISVSALPAGIYVVQLRGESEVFQTKLTVKQM